MGASLRNGTLIFCVEKSNLALTGAYRSVRSLESQNSELQTEASRLLRLLELQKEESQNQAAAAQKQHDDLAKNTETWQSELQSLRAKVKQFDDYDEIRRELEIMKVIKITIVSVPHMQPDI